MYCTKQNNWFQTCTRDVQQLLLGIQHVQVKISADLLDLANNTGNLVDGIKLITLWWKEFYLNLISMILVSSDLQKGCFFSNIYTVFHISTCFPSSFVTLSVVTTNKMVYSRHQWTEFTSFFCKITKLLNSHDMCFQFILNGSARTQNLVYGRSDHAYRTSSNLIVLQLIRGDRNWIRMYGDQSFSGYCCSIVGHFLIYHSDWPAYIWPIYLRISCIIYFF